MKFGNLRFYSDALIKSFTEFDIFSVVHDGRWAYDSNSRDLASIKPLHTAYLSIQFHQGQKQTTLKSTRLNFFQVMSKTGALVAFVFRFSVIVIAGSQHFSMATNFMQKIYSVEGKPSEDHDQGKNNQ